jgi:hypothetical protein
MESILVWLWRIYILAQELRIVRTESLIDGAKRAVVSD